MCYAFQENVAKNWEILKDVQFHVQRTKRNSWEYDCCWKIREDHAMKQTVHVRFHFCWYFCNQKFTVLISRNMAVSNVNKKDLALEDSIFVKEIISARKHNTPWLLWTIFSYQKSVQKTLMWGKTESPDEVVRWVTFKKIAL